MAGFQSFAERYIIERASTFKAGQEKEDAWAALQDAETIFKMVERADRRMITPQQAGVAASPDIVVSPDEMTRILQHPGSLITTHNGQHFLDGRRIVVDPHKPSLCDPSGPPEPTTRRFFNRSKGPLNAT